MTTYKCFKCGKKIQSNELDSRFKCTNCDSKVFYKPRVKAKKVKAV